MRRSTSGPAGSKDQLSPITWTGIRRLIALAVPYRLLLAIAGVLTLVSTGISLALPLISQRAVDYVTRTKEVGELDRIAVGIVGLVLVGAIFGYAQFLIAAFAGNSIVKDLRLKLFRHLQRLEVGYFDKTRSGDLTSYLSNDVSLLQTTLTDDLVKLIPNFLTLIGGVVIAIVIDWRLTMVVVTLLMAVMLFFVIFGRRLRKITREGLDALSDTMGAMTEALANIRLVKAFAREPFEDKRAREKMEGVFKLNMKGSIWEGMMGTVAGAGFSLVLLGVMWYGGRSVLSGALSLGSLVGFVMIVTIITGPMGNLASLYTRLQRSVGAADRLFAILDEKPELPDVEGAVGFPSGPGAVQFQDLSFAYVETTPVLKGLSLSVPAGKVTAIVGPSGSGKTTLSSLLYRFYESQSGQILIDGTPIRQIHRQALRENIGIVPQEPILFNGTIRENIRYGRLEANDAEVEAAGRGANVEEFVKGFPEGYDTMVGERGITLSGGQRQRVAIARAMLKDPRILVLDEATSALDNRSEALVREALDRLMVGRTTLVIAHRLSTIQNADQIAVLKDGQITELGRHAELLEGGGVYADLYELVKT